MLQGVGQDALPHTITTDGYLELEFTNDAEFSSHFWPAKDAVQVTGNIWRIYFEQDMDNVIFNSMMYYHGSTGMAPIVIWAQMCRENDAAWNTTDPEITTQEMTTLTEDPTEETIIDAVFLGCTKLLFGFSAVGSKNLLAI